MRFDKALLVMLDHRNGPAIAGLTALVLVPAVRCGKKNYLSCLEADVKLCVGRNKLDVRLVPAYTELCIRDPSS